MEKQKSFFITGTGTDIGKTLITAGIADLCISSGLKTAVMKPVQTGLADGMDDLKSIHNCVPGLLKLPITISSPYSFQLAASPHLASACENITIDPAVIKIAYSDAAEFDLDVLLMEGAGGVYVPLNETYLMLDLMKELNVQVIVTALAGLGTINHTLMTINALKAHRIPIAGIIINRMPQHASLIEKDNVNIIEQISETPIIGIIHEMPQDNLLTQEKFSRDFAKQEKLKKILFE